MTDSDPTDGITLERRRIIRALAGAGVLGLAGCSGNGGGDDPDTELRLRNGWIRSLR
jgi:hypothetical protein